MKQGSLFVLFCIVLMRSTKLGFFRSASWCLWKALYEEGCMGLVPRRLDLQCKVLEYRMISSLKIKLNCSWKFRRNWNVPLVLLERSGWRGNTWANGTGHTSIDEINFQNLLLESPQKKKGKSSRSNADFDFAAQLETLHVGQLHIPNITTMPNP
jgi:hypothetical protein